MATRIYFRDTSTHPRGGKWPIAPSQKDMSSTAGSSLFTIGISMALPVSPERTTVYNSKKVAWWSERIQTQVTISGPLSFSVVTRAGVAGHRLRLRLSKMTAGGSDVVTDIAQADTAAELTASDAVYTFSMTLPQPITLAPNERLMFRVSYVKTDGSDVAASMSVSFGRDGTDTWVEFPETITFIPNATTLSLRRTTVTGIGTFMDLLPAFGVTAFTTAVVNTVASGTEIVWTKTAGGITAEWISPRLAAQWDLPVTAFGPIAFSVSASESATAANVQPFIKVFVRKPTGTELFIAQDTPSSGTEITTTLTAYTTPMSSDVYTVQNVGEDDRLVVRVYIIPSAGLTMGGSRTATLGYDGVGPWGALGSSAIQVFDLPPFKAEGDPAKSDIVPSGQSTVGMSNGQ